MGFELDFTEFWRQFDMARKVYYWGSEKVVVIQRLNDGRLYVKCENGSFAYVPKTMLTTSPK